MVPVDRVVVRPLQYSETKRPLETQLPPSMARFAPQLQESDRLAYFSELVLHHRERSRIVATVRPARAARGAYRGSPGPDADFVAEPPVRIDDYSRVDLARNL